MCRSDKEIDIDVVSKDKEESLPSTPYPNTPHDALYHDNYRIISYVGLRPSQTASDLQILHQ